MPKERQGSKNSLERYGLKWEPNIHPVSVELTMIRKGGRWIKDSGGYAGEGLFFHYKRLQELLWPQKEWHRWNLMLLEELISNRFIGILGPASSGKTHEAGLYGLCTYYAFADQTTVMCSSTERERLEERVWGEIKKYHKIARAQCEWLPGQLLESRQRILTDERLFDSDGRDFRNGLVGVPCKKGGSYVGLGCFPSGTLIDTPSGPMPIESIKPDDVILNALGESRVKQVSTRFHETLVRIHAGDIIFDCTPGHPILTQIGWVHAVDLKPHHRLISTHEALSIMRFENRMWSASETVLLKKMQMEGAAQRAQLCYLRQDSPSNVSRKTNLLFSSLQSAIQTETVPSMRGNVYTDRCEGDFLYSLLRSEMESQPATYYGEDDCGAQLGSRRQKSQCHDHEQSSRTSAQSRKNALPEIKIWPDQTGGNVTPAVSRIDFQRHHCSHSAGFELARNKTGGGNRWLTSSIWTPSGIRSLQGIDPEASWVDRVEILERGSDKRFNNRENGYRVHNLEVEGHPSYSVNGILVHNSFAGVKNKRVILIADEGQFMPQAYVDAISNLNKNAGFQCIVMGNPKDTTDALGKVCEPAADIGGWDGGVDQTGGTKKWKTRFPGGVCVQLVGSDSPNMDYPEDQPPRYPYLITREAIANDVAFYGRDSLQFSMMNDGRMPRGQGLRRVITRQMCQKFDALVEPIWASEKRTKIGFLDAAYGSVGGDRCIFGELQFGPGLARDGSQLTLLALIQTMLVPVSVKENELPEDQIAKFCKEQCEARGISPENFGFDSTGRGTLMGAFARLWSAYVVPIEFGGKATDRPVSAENTTICKDFYSKFVSELWYSVRLTIESRQFRGMTEEVMQEGTMREWKLVTGNRVEVESKVEMKDKMGRSPDLFDALVAGVEMARRKGFMIAKLSKVRSVTDENWKEKLRDRAAKLARAGELNYSA